jgi:hypothetical protein
MRATNPRLEFCADAWIVLGWEVVSQVPKRMESGARSRVLFDLRARRMLPWWKRLTYSFLSVLFGGSVVGIAASFPDAVSNSAAHVDLGRLLFPACIVVIASLSGWLVAIPIVLLVRDYSGWRLWLWGAVGICIGPSVVFGFGLYGYLTDPLSAGFIAGISGFLLLAILVSALSTGAFLFLANRANTDAVQ